MFRRSRYVLFPLPNGISSDGVRQVTSWLLQLMGDYVRCRAGGGRRIRLGDGQLRVSARYSRATDGLSRR